MLDNVEAPFSNANLEKTDANAAKKPAKTANFITTVESCYTMPRGQGQVMQFIT